MSHGTRRAVNRTTARTLLAVSLVLATAWPALAQRRTPPREPHGFYVSLSAFGDIERFSQTSLTLGEDADRLFDGQTAGVGIGIGTFVTARWSIEFEAATRRSIDSPLEVHTYPPPRGDLNGILETRSRERHRMDSGTVLLAFHPSRRGRVRLAYSAGLTLGRLEREFTYDETFMQGGQTQALHDGLGQTDFVIAPTVQIEASVRIARRFALVPYLRALAFNVNNSSAGTGAVMFNAGAALRFRF